MQLSRKLQPNNKIYTVQYYLPVAANPTLVRLNFISVVPPEMQQLFRSDHIASKETGIDFYPVLVFPLYLMQYKGAYAIVINIQFSVLNYFTLLTCILETVS